MLPPNSASSVDYTIEYFTSNTWGKHYDEDKYWDDEDLINNFIIFYCHAFSYLNLPRPSRAQLEIARFVADTDNPHRMVQAMRGLSKSLSSQLYVVWRLLRDPNEKILVMSAGATRAGNFTQFVQRLISMLPITKHMTPRHNKERTSTQAFDVAGAEPSDSPSLYAVGVGNQITGMRASLVIYDDIETTQNAGSTVQREKVDHFANEAANILMTGKDESIVLCTPHSADSIYTDWINSRGFKHLVIPAEYPEDINVYGNGLAPYILERIKANKALVGTNVDERFTLDILASKRQRIGKSQYKLQYMLDVTMTDDLKHPLKLSDLIVMDVDMDNCPIKISPSSMRENIVYTKHNGFKNDKFYAPSYVSTDSTDYGYRVMAIDPSGRGSDETGISIVFSGNGKLFIKKLTGIDGGYDYDNLLQVANMCKDHNVDTLVVESNFGDGAFTRMIEPILRSISSGTAIEEVRAKGQKEKRIIETLEPLLNQRKIVIDKKVLDDDLLSMAQNYSFTYQLTHISSLPNCLKHDDRLDSLEMACKFIIERETFDEDNAVERFSQQKLEDDLNKFFADYGLNYSSNSNYGSNY